MKSLPSGKVFSLRFLPSSLTSLYPVSQEEYFTVSAFPWAETLCIFFSYKAILFVQSFKD